MLKNQFCYTYIHTYIHFLASRDNYLTTVKSSQVYLFNKAYINLKATLNLNYLYV